MVTRSLVCSLAIMCACGDNLKGPIDAAPIDATPDSPPVDDGPCGTNRFIGAELLDWDSTGAAFMGVNAATFTQRGGTATTTTPPNGRVEMCVGTTTSYIFDVDVASATYLDAIAYFDLEAIVESAPADRHIRFRGITTARATSFYVERSLVYDPTKAHVLVYLAGDVSDISLDRAHGTPQLGTYNASTDSITWTSGAGSAKYVLFPNVDASSPTGVIEGDLGGDHSVPLEAGKLTLVGISWVFDFARSQPRRTADFTSSHVRPLLRSFHSSRILASTRSFQSSLYCSRAPTP
jgi:hypothetical protein